MAHCATSHVPLHDVHPAGKFSAFLSPRWLVAGVCLLLSLMVLAVFWQCRGFAFVNFDDNVLVYSNKHVQQGLTWQNVGWSLTAGIGRDSVDTDFWRPLSLMSHMLDVSLFGLNPGAHHLVSVAMHLLTTLVLFLVLQAMTGRLWCSAFVAAFFAVHPLHVESVAWVAERKDVLSGLFFVLTLGAYVRYVRRPFQWGRYLLVLLLCALALMSKPMLVTLPCVLLLLDFWPLDRTRTVPAKRLLAEKLPMFIMVGMVSALTLTLPGNKSAQEWAGLPWYYNTGNAVLSYGVYLRQTLWPEGLTCFYLFPGSRLDFGSVAAAGVVLAAISSLAWWYRRQPCVLVGWLWYLGMLVPVIGLFKQAGGQAHADRYTYLPMIGLSMMVVWPLADWAGTRRSRRLVLGAASVAVLIVLMITAHAQASHWRDTRSLWTHAVRCFPGNASGHANLGTSLIEAGQTQEAIASFERALLLYPEQRVALLNLGLIQLRAGHLDEAAVHLRGAVKADPKSAEAHHGLAYILLQRGELEEAILHFQQAADIRPDVGNCLNLGNALLQAGQFARAIDSYLQVIAEDPNHADARYCLGMAYARLGKMDTALRHYQSALKANPGHLPAINNLAWLLATSRNDTLRNGALAVELVEHALQLPGASKPYLMRTLAAAYAETGQYDKASQIALQASGIASTQGYADLARELLRERNTYLSGVPWRE